MKDISTELLDCQEKLRQLNANFEDFTYIVSHDLKAPVRAILNLSNWIEEDLGENINGEIKANLQLLRDRSDRLEKMITAILTISRLGRLDNEICSVNISALIQNIVSKLLLKPSVQVTVNIDLPIFNTYASRLDTVLHAILENAVCFSDKFPATVHVKAFEEPDNYIFKITDNGPGIPVDALNKIFSIFYTVQSKDQKYTTGAGLAIAKKAAALSGGAITVTSVLNEGSTFTISWPKTVSSLA